MQLAEHLAVRFQRNSIFGPTCAVPRFDPLGIIQRSTGEKSLEKVAQKSARSSGLRPLIDI